MMRLSTKSKLAILGVAGALTLATATPSMAYWRHGHWYNDRYGAGPVGFAAGVVGGTIAGAAAVASAPFGGPGYYGDYAYAPGYSGDYAYAPGPSAYASAPAGRGCFVKTETTRPYGYFGSCAAMDQAINTGSGQLETDNQAALP